MEQIKKLELVLADWYKNAPHLPKNGQKWLTENVWWIVLIGVILSAIGAVMIIFGTLFAGTLLTVVGGLVGAAVGGILLVAVLVSLAFSVIEIVLSAMAITPLKNGKKRGWNYLFVAYLVMVLSVVVSFIFHFSTGGFIGLIWNVIWLAIIGYFLFEVRSHLVQAKTVGKTHAK
jgi:hypothetical protein